MVQEMQSIIWGKAETATYAGMASEFGTECVLGITHKPIPHLAGLHVSNVLQPPNAGFSHLGATYLFQPMNLWGMFDL